MAIMDSGNSFTEAGSPKNPITKSTSDTNRARILEVMSSAKDDGLKSGISPLPFFDWDHHREWISFDRILASIQR